MEHFAPRGTKTERSLCRVSNVRHHYAKLSAPPASHSLPWRPFTFALWSNPLLLLRPFALVAPVADVGVCSSKTQALALLLLSWYACSYPKYSKYSLTTTAVLRPGFARKRARDSDYDPQLNLCFLSIVPSPAVSLAMAELYPSLAQCAVVATALKVLLFPA